MNDLPAKPLPPALRNTAAALAGALIGWLAVSTARPSAPPSSAHSGADSSHADGGTGDSSAGSARSGDGTRTGPDPTRRFAALKRYYEEWGSIPDDARRTLESMSAAELKDYLLTMNRGDGRSFGQIMMSESLRGAATRLLYQQDPEGTLAWARDQDPEQGGLLEKMARTAAKADPTQFEPWSALLTEKANDQKGKEIAASAWSAAAGTDAASILALEKNPVIGESLAMFGVRGLEFAEGFDFTRYVKDSTIMSGLRHALIQWAARDPEKAFSSIAERGKGTEDGHLYSAVYEGMACLKGDAAATAFITEKLASLPDEERGAASAGLLQARGFTAARMDLLLKGMPREEDRFALAEQATIPFVSGSGDILSTRVLATLDPARQLAALESSVKRYQAQLGNPGTFKEIRSGYDIIMERINLPEESREQLRQTLAGPP
ncbi:hypothetical protein OJ996_22240 [Luteolibacter sp. GHJ8]|uniref:DUF4034 domain-containing protein n=1 Tax=Luteolibacter rhizosphaerae TaxID=2989719 RepID=A0ABT3GAS0_9BACT|nr:hypothetical protein [Luteolibacter rhizosphaerae]MCW1916325.1 hypothetical protein [Luteolibacter rhizosphaerae]